MSITKKYLIELFLKRCTLQYINEKHIGFYIDMLSNTYFVSEENKAEIKEKYSLERYIERISPIIDSFFNEGELKTAIQFFSSGVGKKMLDKTFLDRIGRESQQIINEIENEFSTKHQERL